MARMLAVLGTVFQFGPLLGFVSMWVGSGRWPESNSGQAGQAEIDHMTEVVARAFNLFTVGYLWMLAGLVLLAIGLWGMRYRAPGYRPRNTREQGRHKRHTTWPQSTQRMVAGPGVP